MKRALLGMTLALLGCSQEGGTLVAEPVHPVVVLPLDGPRLDLTGAGELTWANLTVEEGLIKVDLVTQAPLADAYGLAFRLEVQGARFVDAVNVDAGWRLSRVEPTASGAVGVWSLVGVQPARTFDGRLATFWFEPIAGAKQGGVQWVPSRSGRIDGSGQRRALTAVHAGWRLP